MTFILCTNAVIDILHFTVEAIPHNKQLSNAKKITTNKITIVKYLYEYNRMSLNCRDGRHSLLLNGMNVIVKGSRIKIWFIRSQK